MKLRVVVVCQVGQHILERHHCRIKTSQEAYGCDSMCEKKLQMGQLVCRHTAHVAVTWEMY